LIDNGDGSYTYALPSGFEGLDSFSYTVEDPSGAQATAVIYVNVIGETPVVGFGTSPVDSTVDPGPPTAGTESETFEITPGSEPDTATPDTDDTDSSETHPEISGGHGGLGIPAAVGGVGFSTSTFDFNAEVEMADGLGDGQPKNRIQKFQYDGVLDGFEFQGFGLKPVGINQEVLWLALDDMQRQMSGLDDSSNRSFLIASVTSGSGLLLTTGLISWVLRGGALASTLLSTVPLWTGVDPLPLLAGRKKKKKEDAITDTQLIERAQEFRHSRTTKEVENMFANPANSSDDSRGAGQPS